MIIPVAGMDPALRNWGTAEGLLCLDTGMLDEVKVGIARTKKGKTKQVRVNSDDLQRCEDLAQLAFEVGERRKVVFIECPVGSQNASGMKSYGASIGIVACMRTKGIQVIEVTADEVKVALTGNKNASKADMIAAAFALYPDAGWNYDKGKLTACNEHRADAIGAIHAGVLTPAFQQLMSLFKKVTA